MQRGVECPAMITFIFYMNRAVATRNLRANNQVKIYFREILEWEKIKITVIRMGLRSERRDRGKQIIKTFEIFTLLYKSLKFVISIVRNSCTM